MRSPTTEFFRRIPVARWAPLFLAAGVAACSSNNSDTGGTPVHLTLVTGGGISATVGTAVGPIVVRVTDADTLPVAGVPVTFAITGAGATLTVTSVATDAQGDALTSVQLGHVAGVVTVTATAQGIAQDVTLQATGIADAPVNFTITGGNNESETHGQQLPDPLVVKVTDQYGNGVSGATVTWVASGGTLNAGTSRTDANGSASILLTLPAAPGAVTVTASILLNSGSAMLTFNETAN